MKDKKNKKAQAANVTLLISLIVGVAAATIVLIFVGVLGGSVYQTAEPKLDALTTEVTNETVTLTNSTTVNLAYINVVEGSLTLYRINDSVSVPLGNITIDYDAGSLYLRDAYYSSIPLAATYVSGNAAIEAKIKQASISGFDALKTTADYIPIIVMAFIIIIVLGAIMGLQATYGGGGGSGGQAL